MNPTQKWVTVTLVFLLGMILVKAAHATEVVTPELAELSVKEAIEKLSRRLSGQAKEIEKPEPQRNSKRNPPRPYNAVTRRGDRN